MGPYKNMLTKVVTHQKTPLVLTVVACGGVVLTGIMSAKAAPKASMVISEKKSELNKDRLHPFDVAKCTWKYYAPVVGVGTITIAAIITMNRVTAKNAAILTAGATLATTTLQEYQQHVLEELGSEKESKIRDKIAKRRVAKIEPEIIDQIVISGDETVCYDELSGRIFKSSMEEIRAVENEINRQILSGVCGSASLNEVYERLNLEPNELGSVLGFNIETPLDFHFSSQIVNKKPVLSVGYIHTPVEGFANFT